MENKVYAFNIFKRHVQKHITNPNGTILEIGPGDSPYSSIISIEYGFSKALLLDNANYFDINKYQKECKMIEYLTEGIDSLRNIESETVDYSFSHTVLQHIHKDEIDSYLKNLYRVMKKDSKSSHYIDFKDMLFGRFNHLIVNNLIWESSIIRSCFFYTNRLRKSQMIRLFKENGFHVTIIEEKSLLNDLKIKRNSLSKNFFSISEDDLSCSSMHILVQKK